MDAMLKLVLYILMLGCITQLALAETRWCHTTLYDPSISPDGWVQYDDQQMTCVKCSNQSIGLLSNSKIDKYECCEGKAALKGTCQGLGIGMFCAAGVQCDGNKQCPDGQDEIGCNECNQTTSFTCTQHADSKPCISSNQVCDGTKDCAEGLDETGCHWHGGWCDGFLCGKPHERCIPKSQVCDGTKQCVDGSDEYNCRYCFMQFRCSVYQRADELARIQRETANTTTAQCIGSFRVCDGIKDCNNSIDEAGCYRWQEWSPWSACYKPFVCTRTRTRSCVNKFGSEVFPSSCYNVEDYHDPNGGTGTETDSQICPVCISTPAVISSPTTSPTATKTAVPITTTTSLPTTSSGISTLPTTLSQTSSTALPTSAATSLSASSTAIPITTTTALPGTTTIFKTSSSTSFQASSTASVTNSLPTSLSNASTAVPASSTTSTAVPTSGLTSLLTSALSSASKPTSTGAPSTTEVASTTVTSSTLTSSTASTTHFTLRDATSKTGAVYETTAHVMTDSTDDFTSSGDGKNNLPTSPFPETQSSATTANNVTSNVTGSTTSPPRPLLSVISLSLVISIAVVAALILMAVICSLVFCCSEQRRKRGKWVPRRRYKDQREFNVPQMYHDVSLDDVRQGAVAPDAKQESVPKPSTLRSFAAVQSAVDSGIDESHSTTSTLEHVTVDPQRLSGSYQGSPTLSSTSSGAGSIGSGELRNPPFRSPSDLPPPPPHLRHNDV